MTDRDDNSYQAGELPAQQAESDIEAQRIVTEIEETRYEMGATINEIGNRLQPQSIADEARDRIREATVGKVERMVDDASQTATRTGTTFIDTIRENPVPAALAAMGIGWLVVRMRDSASSTNGYAARTGGGYDTRYRSSYGQGSRSRSGSYGYGSNGANGGGDAMGRVRDVANQATGTAQDVADQAARRAQDVGYRAQQVGSDVQQTAQQVAQNAVETAQGTVQQAQWQFDRTLSQNPLALGALAVGIGAAVGLALPETQKERELYAEPRQQLVSKVSEVTSQALDQAQTKAEEVGEQLQSNA